MGQRTNKDNAAGGEDAVGLAEIFKPIIQDVLQLSKLTVLHPHDDGTSAVTYRGEDGRERLIRKHYHYRGPIAQTLSQRM
jgi:hypothetical protein